MDPLSAVASVIACYQLASVVGGQCLRYVRGVRQAHKDGDLVIAQIQAFQLSLYHLQGMLANENGNPNGDNRLKFLHEIMNGISEPLVLCSHELEKINAKLSKAQSGSNLREVFHNLAWPLKQEEVDKAITTLNSFAAAVERALTIDTNQVVRGIDLATKDIDSTTKRILISTESAEAQQKQQEKLRKEEEERQKAEQDREKILDWLAHPDPAEIHNNNSRARKSTKTGRWFLDGAAFQEFKETPRSVLWLHGESGCGKSIMCSAIIDELRGLVLKEPKVRLAYWYFSVNDAKRRTLQGLVRALVTQFVPTSAAPPALFGLWEANRKGREAPKTSDLIKTLGQMLWELSMGEGAPAFFLVIDALDESNEAERAEIIDMLKWIPLVDNINIHMLVTSRSNTIGVEQGLRDVAKLFNVVIERQFADEDILTHIAERLQNDEELNKWPLDLRKDVEETIVKKAEGMFRWADCQLQAIRRCMKPKELRKALTSLPTDLREVYAKDVANVEERSAEDVRKLLGWLTYPQRPLRIEEVAEILAVDLDSDPPLFDEENRMPRPEDMFKVCGSLVRIDENPEGRNSLGERAKVRTLTAAHASVVDFLKEKPVRIGLKLEFSFTRATVNLEMAETCLAYLLNFVEGKVMLGDDNIMNYPFARLSAELWDDFYREVVASSVEAVVNMTRVNALIMRLFASREIMLKWVQLCDPDDDTNRVHFDTPISYVKPAIYYAALLGLPDIVSLLIENGHSIDEVVSDDCVKPFDEALGVHCGTPLVAACVYGRENIVSVLLNKGADPNLHGNRYCGCPLAAAIEENQAEIVKLLLKTKGVDVNARRFPHKSARTTQSESGTGMDTITTNVVESRTELPGATFDMVDQPDTRHDNRNSIEAIPEPEHLHYSPSMAIRSFESLVYIAANLGSLEILNDVLEAGADPNIPGGCECTALQVACRRGNVDIVETLLNHSANARICGGKSGSPLQAACACPSLRIVKILIGLGVDVNYIEGGNDSALYLASAAQDPEMVDLLLEHGARTDLYGGLYDNALQIASKKGNIMIVQILLEVDIDVNRRGGQLSTALTAACCWGRTAVARELLEHDADPNVQGCWMYDNALQTACQRDNTDIVLLLLEHEADPNLHGGRYGSALHAAFSKGNEVVIKALLTRGADIRYRGGEFCSILQAAVVSENEAAVKVALECGLSANEKGGSFTYPLLRATATESCPDSIVRLLLEEGADPNLEREGDDFIDRLFRTALQHANSVSKATLLLDSGAQINTVSGPLGTALHTAIYTGVDQDTSMIKLLVNCGADVNRTVENIGPPLLTAVRLARLHTARLLVGAGAALDLFDIVGHSVLHMAIWKAKSGIELFDYFVGLGADPLLLDRRRCNGLHYAARANNLGALKKILERGPDINATDEFCWTPLHWAAASTCRSTQVIRALLDEGCDREMKDKIGRTALDLATTFDNTETVTMLNALGNTDIGLPGNGANGDEELEYIYCDGCGIKPEFCGSENWYKCKDCDEAFDLCFRCIEDKDIIHLNNHSWSDQISTGVKLPFGRYK